MHYYSLPSYNIKYPKKGGLFRTQLLMALPYIFKTKKKENTFINNLVKTKKIDGIISDNRFGVYHKNIPSVYITHQITVLSGFTTWLSSKWHASIIKKFNQCWVPDYKNKLQLSGQLGHPKKLDLATKYIGSLSRFKTKPTAKDIDVLALISGPEPQRSIFEKRLIQELKQLNCNSIIIRGVIESKQKITHFNKLTVYNYMISEELETTLNKSKLVVCRSGYSTIMDLEHLQQKAIFIPTPGQFEQLYLAKYLKNKGVCPYFLQNKFTYKDLIWNKTYTGFTKRLQNKDYADLFGLF